ncbi:hypothetical protein [Thermobacillus composti]|uniref:hypothetical protein n=1 Tax=Thermobacillus composti TaxID=377615 RepID=UPI0012FC4D34|nr:hypothetical protein [Thermobacillus composti]
MAIDIQGLANSLQPVLGLTGQVAGSIPAARTLPLDGSMVEVAVPCHEDPCEETSAIPAKPNL